MQQGTCAAFWSPYKHESLKKGRERAGNSRPDWRSGERRATAAANETTTRSRSGQFGRASRQGSLCVPKNSARSYYEPENSARADTVGTYYYWAAFRVAATAPETDRRARTKRPDRPSATEQRSSREPGIAAGARRPGEWHGEQSPDRTATRQRHCSSKRAPRDMPTTKGSPNNARFVAAPQQTRDFFHFYI